jgi:hypothetical protein
VSGVVVDRASAGWAMVLFAGALALVVPIALLLPTPPEEPVEAPPQTSTR